MSLYEFVKKQLQMCVKEATPDTYAWVCKGSHFKYSCMSILVCITIISWPLRILCHLVFELGLVTCLVYYTKWIDTLCQKIMLISDINRLYTQKFLIKYIFLSYCCQFGCTGSERWFLHCKICMPFPSLQNVLSFFQVLWEPSYFKFPFSNSLERWSNLLWIYLLD